VFVYKQTVSATCVFRNLRKKIFRNERQFTETTNFDNFNQAEIEERQFETVLRRLGHDPDF